MKSSILDENIFHEFAKAHKLQPFRVKQVYFEIYKIQNIELSEMTTLSKELRQDLDKEFSILPFTVTDILEDTLRRNENPTSSGGFSNVEVMPATLDAQNSNKVQKFEISKAVRHENTTKIGLQTSDGHLIEAVLLYHRQDEKYAEDDEAKLNRITLCISSQVGCPMNCLFCVTGKLGLKRNLTREEILGQVLFANNYIKKKFGKKEDGTLYAVRNVVFMGMGEPLLNYDNVKKSIEVMLDQNGLSLSRRHITISTAGIIPGIKKMIEDNIPVKLAISLHAPNQELRNQLMPIAKRYPLDELMETIDAYVKATDNRIFYEYIMIKGITDTPELAKELAKLLKGRLAHVNLIAYNENPAINYQESDEKQIWKFKGLLEKEGITVTIRASMGREAKGACGQLGYEKIMNN